MDIFIRNFEMADPTVFTVPQLKDKLMVRGLSVAGSKSKFIARLMEADPSESWMSDLDGPSGDVDDVGVCGAGGRGESLMRREIDFYKREKELAERELKLAQREIEMLRESQQGNLTDCS